MKTKQTLKRILAWVLSVALVLSLTNGLTITSAAEDGISYLDENGDEQTVTDYTEVTSDTTTWNGSEAEAWYVVSGDVTIESRITVSGDVNLILVDGASLTADQGITVQASNSLTIYGQTEGSGELIATSGGNDAGIGGAHYNAAGIIIINGGTVTADGGTYGAGIGAGSMASGGNITINGGTVTAVGNTGAGIGSGFAGNVSASDVNITINGGIVTATTTSSGAAIGGGSRRSGGTINITGGLITATGTWGAGIGAGNNGSGADITIDGNAVIWTNSITGDTDAITSGLVFYGGSSYGIIYGETVTTDVDWELPSGYYVIIDEGQAFSTSVDTTITNKGAICVGYGGSLSGTVTYTDDGTCYYELAGTGDVFGDGGIASYASTDGQVTYDSHIYYTEGTVITFAESDAYCYVTANGTNYDHTITIYSYGISVDTVAHVHADDDEGTVTDSNCASKGYTTYKCIVCSMNYTDEYTDIVDCTKDYNEDGFCPYCGQYEPATLVNGVYQISNPGQLMWFAALVNGDDSMADFEEQDKTANAILLADLDMTDIDFTPIASTKLYNEIEETGKITDWGYAGTFDGNGHVISNVTVAATSAVTVGLFGTVSGTVKNLGMDNFTYKHSSGDMRAAAVAGVVLPGGTVECCYVVNSTVTVSGAVAGGLVGANYGGTVANCYAYNNSVSATRYGFLVGDNKNDKSASEFYGTITNCYVDKSSSMVGKTNGSEDVTYKTSTIFASGEVCYLLNDGVTDGTQTWYQTIGTENYPVFAGKTVYQVKVLECDGVTLAELAYSNSNEDTVEDHAWKISNYDWSEDGTSCTITITCANDETHVATVTGTYDDGFPSVTEDDFAVPISITYTAETEFATCLDDSVTTYTVEGTIDDDEVAAVSLLSVDVYDTKTVTNDNTALGHDYSVTSSIDASCVAAGSNTYTCSRCDSTYTETVAALGHTFEDGVCTVCGLSVVTANEESPEEEEDAGEDEDAGEEIAEASSDDTDSTASDLSDTEDTEEEDATTSASTGDKTPVALLIMIFFQAFALAIAIRRRKLK